MNEEQKVTYKDTEGNKLFGFSQRSLDRNTFWIKVLVFVLGIPLIILIIYLIFVVYQIMHYDILTNIVNRCIC